MRAAALALLFSSSVVLAGEAQAAAHPAASAAEAAQDAESEEFGMLYNLASQMLGHVTMARDALAFGLYSDASDNINLARQEAASLASRTPGFNSQYMPRAAAAGKDYLFPVMDNTVTMQEINAGRAGASTRVDVTGAQEVRYMLFIDANRAEKALTRAQADAKAGNYAAVMTSLRNIANGAVLEASVYDTPLEAARDNLMLARALVKNRQYRGAAYALRHAQYELARAQKEAPKQAGGKDMEDLRNQIADMRRSLAQEHPSFTQREEEKISRWIHRVEARLRRHDGAHASNPVH